MDDSEVSLAPQLVPKTWGAPSPTCPWRIKSYFKNLNYQLQVHISIFYAKAQFPPRLFPPFFISASYKNVGLIYIVDFQLLPSFHYEFLYYFKFWCHHPLVNFLKNEEITLCWTIRKIEIPAIPVWVPSFISISPLTNDFFNKCKR